VTAYSCAVFAAQDGVHVDHRFSVECCNVADQGEHLHLLAREGWMVHLFFQVEPGRGGGADGSDVGEVGVADLVFDGEVGEAAEDFVAFEEDDGVDLFFGCVFDELDLHAGGFAGGDGPGRVDVAGSRRRRLGSDRWSGEKMLDEILKTIKNLSIQSIPP